MPEWIVQQLNFEEIAKEWILGGYPAAISQPLTADVKRINMLPMTDFVADMITKFLAEAQGQAFRAAG